MFVLCAHSVVCQGRHTGTTIKSWLATLILSLYTYQAPNVRSLLPIDEIDETSAVCQGILQHRPPPPPSPTRPGPSIIMNPGSDVRVLVMAENHAHCRM
jgi:hypothetical protein